MPDTNQSTEKVRIEVIERPDKSRDLLMTYESGRRVLYRNATFAAARFESGPVVTEVITTGWDGNPDFEEPR